MFGLMIRDIFSIRKRIYFMILIMILGDASLLSAALMLQSKHKGNASYELKLQTFFKGGIMVVSFISIFLVFLMVKIVVTDKKTRWDKMLMAFPISGVAKGTARYMSFLVISLMGGILELSLTFVMFRVLKYDIQIGTVKYVYCPFAIGLLFIFIRLIFEYKYNSFIAIEYCSIIAALIVASSYVIYKFGDMDFPYNKFEVIKLYMKQFDRWLISIIPCVMALGLLMASDRMTKPKTVKQTKW